MYYMGGQKVSIMRETLYGSGLRLDHLSLFGHHTHFDVTLSPLSIPLLFSTLTLVTYLSSLDAYLPLWCLPPLFLLIPPLRAYTSTLNGFCPLSKPTLPLEAPSAPSQRLLLPLRAYLPPPPRG